MTAPDRLAAATALAEALGWALERYTAPVAWGSPEEITFKVGPITPIRPEDPHGPKSWAATIRFPAAAAPLPEHLAFVGHVAEALGRDKFEFLLCDEGYLPTRKRHVQFTVIETEKEFGTCESDYSWAACVAGASAKKGARP